MMQTVDEDTRIVLEWAEEVQRNPLDFSSEEIAVSNYILTTTEHLTMKGVEWDHDKHHLAEVRYPSGYTGVMIVPELEDKILVLDDELGDTLSLHREELIPTGKRYRLVEDEEEKPEYLDTTEDFKSAPLDTVWRVTDCARGGRSMMTPGKA